MVSSNAFIYFWYNAPAVVMKREKSVLISLWSAGSCGRKQLAGILRYINAGHPWNIRIILDPKDFSTETIAEAERNGTDGYIAFATPEAAAALAALDTPTVLISYPTKEIRGRKRNMTIFVNDNERIGRDGADYFLSLGTFATYAFVPDLAGRGWSREREGAFRRRLAEKGFAVQVYDGKTAELDAWLKSLPKPVAVMTPFDVRSRDVANACKNAGLAVPKDVSILGVDDDELICEAAHPSLTSIPIDQEYVGFKVAEALNRLMSARRTQPVETSVMPSGKVVERASTRPVSPSVHLVAKIQAMINERFREGLTVDDIASRLGVSRRLADLRFSESTGGTIRAALEKRRLDEIKRRLETSDLPIAKITRLCGIRNDLWIKYVFKKQTGQTMTEWRKASKRK